MTESLDLHHNRIVDDEIRKILAHNLSVKVDFDRTLLHYRVSGFPHTNGQRVLVHFLEELDR